MVHHFFTDKNGVSNGELSRRRELL